MTLQEIVRGQRVVETHDGFGAGTVTHFNGDENGAWGHGIGVEDVWVEFDTVPPYEDPAIVGTGKWIKCKWLEAL